MLLASNKLALCNMFQASLGLSCRYIVLSSQEFQIILISYLIIIIGISIGHTYNILFHVGSSVFIIKTGK